MPHPQRILIIRTGALGDVVNALPLAMAIKDAWPLAHVAWVVHPRAAPILQGHRAIDAPIVWDKTGGFGTLARLVERLRSEHFDLALDLGRTAKSALIALTSGAQRRIGFDRARTKELAWVTGGERLGAPADPPTEARPEVAADAPRGAGPRYRKPPEAGGHVVDQFLEFATHLGIAAKPIRWGITPDAGAAERVEARWPAGTGPRLALVAGATKPANRWPERRWADLARVAIERLGARVILVGAAADAATTRAIRTQLGPTVVDLAGQTTVAELVALLAASDAVVSGDTGPLHVAVALGRPVVALFGAADAWRTGPYGRPDSVIAPPMACSPCRRRRCPLGQPSPCLDRIDSALVLERLTRTLA